MNLKTVINQSKAAELTSFLFADSFELQLSKTLLGRHLPSFFNSFLAGASIFGAIFLLWYEQFLDKYIPFLGQDFLPLFLIGLALLFSSKGKFMVRKHHLWFLLFLCFSILAGIIGASFGFGGWQVMLGWLLYLQFALALVVGELTAKNLNRYLILGSLPLILGGFYELITNRGGSAYSYLERGGVRIDSVIGNPNIFAFILVLLTFIGIKEFFASGISRLAKILYGLFIVSCLLLIVFSGSRTAWLALLAGGGVAIAFYKARLLLVAPLLAAAGLSARVRERISKVFSAEYLYDSAIDGRIWSLKNGLYIWKKFPLGTGPGTYGGKLAKEAASPVYLESMQNGYTALYTTDNQYLSLLVQTGLLGFFGFLGFLTALLVAFTTNKSRVGMAILTAFGVMMFFSNALEFSVVAVPAGFLLGQSLRK